jgi:biopolymer transport protein ExbD
LAGLETSNSSEESGLMSSINITPFVDVVLVLLVIFMVTAPMLMKDILELHLPKTVSGDGQMVETLGVAINRDGNILLNGQITDDSGLQEAARAALAKNADSQAIISADRDVVYGRVVKVIDLLKTSGLNKFAVQIEKEEKSP